MPSSSHFFTHTSSISSPLHHNTFGMIGLLSFASIRSQVLLTILLAAAANAFPRGTLHGSLKRRSPSNYSIAGYQQVFGPSDGCFYGNFLNQIPLGQTIDEGTALQQCANLCNQCTAPCDRIFSLMFPFLL